MIINNNNNNNNNNTGYWIMDNTERLIIYIVSIFVTCFNTKFYFYLSFLSFITKNPNDSKERTPQQEVGVTLILK